MANAPESCRVADSGHQLCVLLLFFIVTSGQGRIQPPCSATGFCNYMHELEPGHYVGCTAVTWKAGPASELSDLGPKRDQSSFDASWLFGPRAPILVSVCTMPCISAIMINSPRLY